MRIFKIHKRRGAFRLIYAPNRKEKMTLRRLGKRLERKVRRRESAVMKRLTMETPFLHGFVRGRSPVTNAFCHIGKAFTVSFDLKDFFDSVTIEQLKKDCIKGWPIMGQKLRSLVTVDGAARQGLPTSPHVANLAAMPMDRAILEWIHTSHKELLALSVKVDVRPDIVYTRYADDMTFSCNIEGNVKQILEKIPEFVKAHGFELNVRKTEVQRATNGRRVITGVAVDHEGVYATREVRRKLRAAKHQSPDAERTRGLVEWCKLRMPSEYAKHTEAYKLLQGMSNG